MNQYYKVYTYTDSGHKNLVEINGAKYYTTPILEVRV